MNIALNDYYNAVQAEAKLALFDGRQSRSPVEVPRTPGYSVQSRYEGVKMGTRLVNGAGNMELGVVPLDPKSLNLKGSTLSNNLALRFVRINRPPLPADQGRLGFGDDHSLERARSLAWRLNDEGSSAAYWLEFDSLSDAARSYARSDIAGVDIKAPSYERMFAQFEKLLGSEMRIAAPSDGEDRHGERVEGEGVAISQDGRQAIHFKIANFEMKDYKTEAYG